MTNLGALAVQLAPNRDDMLPDFKQLTLLEKEKKYIDPLLWELLHRTTPQGAESRVSDLILSEIAGVVDLTDEDVVFYLGDNLCVDLTTTGNSILFCSHMNTVHKDEMDLFLWADEFTMTYASDREGNAHASGASSMLGVLVMIRMIQKAIPGMYIFHTGNGKILRDNKGEKYLIENFSDMLKTFTHAVGFDGEGYEEIVTHLKNNRTCSDEFVRQLCVQLNNSLQFKPSTKKDKRFKSEKGLPEVELSVRRAQNNKTFAGQQYFEHIDECTSIPVGVFNKFTLKECFDSHFFSNMMLPAVLKADWGSLPRVPRPKASKGNIIYLDDRSAEFQSSEQIPEEEVEKAKEEGQYPTGISFDVIPFKEDSIDDLWRNKIELRDVIYSTPLSQVPSTNFSLGVLPGLSPSQMIPVVYKQIEKLMLNTMRPDKPHIPLALRVVKLQAKITDLQEELDEAIAAANDLKNKVVPENLILELDRLNDLEKENKRLMKENEELINKADIIEVVVVKDLQNQVRKEKKKNSTKDRKIWELSHELKALKNLKGNK